MQSRGQWLESFECSQLFWVFISLVHSKIMIIASIELCSVHPGWVHEISLSIVMWSSQKRVSRVENLCRHTHSLYFCTQHSDDDDDGDRRSLLASCPLLLADGRSHEERRLGGGATRGEPGVGALDPQALA